MEALGVEKKTMPYVHNPVIIFTDGCASFMEEWLFYDHQYEDLTSTFDEGIYNVLLWKHGAVDWINLCDPYYQLVVDYLYGTDRMHKIHAYEQWIGRIDFYLFHGCKRAFEAKAILQRLIEESSKESILCR